MQPDDHAGKALEAIERALEEKPHKEGHTFSAAARHLSALRDSLIARKHEDEAQARRDLEHVNAVISVILAGHFPLGEVPWDELKLARRWMAEYVAAHP